MAMIKPNRLVMDEHSSTSFVYNTGRIQRIQLISLKDSDSDSDAPQIPGTRKRKRLTNLSPEEKLLRRKLKNRVAAQTARDRKKARMQELEDALATMEAENKKLLAENASLKKSTTVLSNENNKLKECISSGVKCEAVDTKEVAELSESAVLTSSQQQRQAQAAILLATTNFLTTVITISLIHCVIFWMGFTRTYVQKKQLAPTALPAQLNRDPALPPWWGAHQQSWNPAKKEDT